MDNFKGIWLFSIAPHFWSKFHRGVGGVLLLGILPNILTVYLWTLDPPCDPASVVKMLLLGQILLSTKILFNNLVVFANCLYHQNHHKHNRHLTVLVTIAHHIEVSSQYENGARPDLAVVISMSVRPWLMVIDHDTWLSVWSQACK